MRTAIVSISILLVASCVVAEPVVWSSQEGGNGNYYEHVPGGVDWASAQHAATQRTWLGAPGHLATLTSAEEIEWVWTNLGEPFQAWLGAYQVDPSQGASVGWTWVTGEPWSYTNWWPGEPNDGGDTTHEDVLHFAQTGAWNDLDRIFVVEAGMIVEYEAGAIANESSEWGRVKALFR